MYIASAIQYQSPQALFVVPGKLEKYNIQVQINTKHRLNKTQRREGKYNSYIRGHVLSSGLQNEKGSGLEGGQSQEGSECRGLG